MAVSVTPESAGWSFAGLRVLTLEPGVARTLATGPDEVAVLPLAGSCRVETEGLAFELAGRPDVFHGVSDFAYLPMECEAVLSSEAGARIALPSARARRRLEPAYGPAEDVPVEIRGAGRSSRQLNNFCAPDTFPADRLVSVECLTPAGNWSSWPPHKHDEAGPGEAVLEEIYYFETGAEDPTGIRPGEGFGVMRCYSDDGQLDLCEQVHQGDVVLIPRGYHGPSATAPGYHLYHLNVLAGPAEGRTMAFCDDPAHQWVRRSWDHQAPDPRLPLTRAGRPSG